MNGKVLQILVLLTISGPAAAEVQLESHEQWPGSLSDHTLAMRGGVAVRLSGRVEDALIGPAVISGAHQAIWTGSKAVIRNLLIEGVTVTNAGREGIRIRGDADGVRIRDFAIKMRDVPQSGHQLPTGIALYSGRNIVIQNGSVSGFRMRPVKNKYTNGDGIASERAVDGLTILDVSSSDNSDGGFDLKGNNISLDRLTATNNKRNYRFWGDVHAGTLTSVNARGAAIGIKGDAADPPLIEIGRLVIRQDKPVTLILVEGGPADIRIQECDIQAPPGTKLLAMKGAGTTDFGIGCTL